VEESYLTVPELASEFRVPIQTVYSWRFRGKAPKSYRVGRRLLFRRTDVDAWLAEHASVGEGS